MQTTEIIQRLLDEKYTVQVIAMQSGVPYMRVYRCIKKGLPLSESDAAKVRAFALVQPCFTRGVQS